MTLTFSESSNYRTDYSVLYFYIKSKLSHRQLGHYYSRSMRGFGGFWVEIPSPWRSIVPLARSTVNNNNYYCCMIFRAVINRSELLSLHHSLPGEDSPGHTEYLQLATRRKKIDSSQESVNGNPRWAIFPLRDRRQLALAGVDDPGAKQSQQITNLHSYSVVNQLNRWLAFNKVIIIDNNNSNNNCK